jgi:transcriptional regulator with XRE-family HTH domain
LNERIKKLRKTLGLTLEKFGERLGVKRNSVSQWENGINNVSDQVRKSICREFGVNEEWLLSGSGPMFIQSSTFSLDEFVKSRGASDLELDIMKAYFDLEPDVRKMIIEHFKSRLAAPKRDLFDDVPDTPEELERRFPPVDPDDKHAAG